MSEQDHHHTHGGPTTGAACHHHHCAPKTADTRRLWVALAIIAGFMVIEVVGGVLSGSLALLADAGHMATDAFALGLALLARHLSARPISATFPFGLKRAQVLAAFVNAIGLFVLMAILLRESMTRMANPAEIQTTLMFVVAVIGLLANIAAFRILHRGDSNDVNMRGALLHVLGDILGSVAAIVSALIIAATGWLLIDPLVTVLVCLLIARSAWALLRETGRVLLQAAPEGLDGERIGASVTDNVAGIAEITDVRVWMLTPDTPQLTMRLRVEGGTDAAQVLAATKRLLRAEFEIAESTIEVTADAPMASAAPAPTPTVASPDRRVRAKSASAAKPSRGEATPDFGPPLHPVG